MQLEDVVRGRIRLKPGVARLDRFLHPRVRQHRLQLGFVVHRQKLAAGTPVIGSVPPEEIKRFGYFPRLIQAVGNGHGIGQAGHAAV